MVELGSAIAVYAVLLVLSITLIQYHPQAWWRFPVALAPMVPAAFILVAFLRFFRRMDELQRRVHLEAFAFAFGASALLTFGYGFLENVGFPHLAWFWVWPVMAAMWILGSLIATRRYR